MSREEIIEKTVAVLRQLPEDKGEEVADFADVMLKKADDMSLQKGMESIAAGSKTFAFLDDEEDLYTLDDLKEIY